MPATTGARTDQARACSFPRDRIRLERKSHIYHSFPARSLICLPDNRLRWSPYTPPPMQIRNHVGEGAINLDHAIADSLVLDP